MDPFDLSVDIEFNDDDDDDIEVATTEKDAEKTKKEAETKTKMKTQKDTELVNDGNSKEEKDKNKENAKNITDVEGFGDDEHKFEDQQTVLPLQGGLAGLITNLSGVNCGIRQIQNLQIPC